MALMDNLIKKSFELTNKSIAVVVLSAIFSLSPLLFVKYPVYSVIYLFLLIGWSGVQIKLLYNTLTEGAALWKNFLTYFKKYFIRFLPLILFSFIFGFIFVLAVAVLLIFGKFTPEDFPVIFSSLYTNYKIWIPMMFLFSVINPYLISFAPVVVIKDTAFFTGIKQTFRFLKNNTRTYLILGVMYIFSTLLSKVFINIPGFDYTSGKLSALLIARSLIFSYLGVFIIYFPIIVLSKNKGR
jgi:hypothetical protein